MFPIFYQLNYCALSLGDSLTWGWRMRLIAPVFFCRNLQTASAPLLQMQLSGCSAPGDRPLLEKQPKGWSGQRLQLEIHGWILRAFEPLSHFHPAPDELLLIQADISLLFSDSHGRLILDKYSSAWVLKVLGGRCLFRRDLSHAQHSVSVLR